MAEGRIKGIAEGRAKGQTEGEELLLIRMVCKKIVKGKTVPQSVSELEMEKDIIEKIYKAAADFAPEYDVEKIRNALHTV